MLSPYDDEETSCPDGDPQRPGICLGYREREPGRLQLRVALGGEDKGVCKADVEEDDEAIRVRLFICYDRFGDHDREYLNCPVHVYLDEPLGDRRVIDLVTGRELPLCGPRFEQPPGRKQRKARAD